eukprot:Lithocolla_globosa_v1_NODE_85_length_6671_cov_4.306832.p1 type:complete len:521 gc:universal NODE_85_length_6671_cov_4.306832:6408-4846(-)
MDISLFIADLAVEAAKVGNASITARVHGIDPPVAFDSCSVWHHVAVGTIFVMDITTTLDPAAYAIDLQLQDGRQMSIVSPEWPHRTFDGQIYEISEPIGSVFLLSPSGERVQKLGTDGVVRSVAGQEPRQGTQARVDLDNLRALWKRGGLLHGRKTHHTNPKAFIMDVRRDDTGDVVGYRFRDKLTKTLTESGRARKKTAAAEGKNFKNTVAYKHQDLEEHTLLALYRKIGFPDLGFFSAEWGKESQEVMLWNTYMAMPSTAISPSRPKASWAHDAFYGDLATVVEVDESFHFMAVHAETGESGPRHTEQRAKDKLYNAHALAKHMYMLRIPVVYSTTHPVITPSSSFRSFYEIEQYTQENSKKKKAFHEKYGGRGGKANGQVFYPAKSYQNLGPALQGGIRSGLLRAPRTLMKDAWNYMVEQRELNYARGDYRGRVLVYPQAMEQYYAHMEIPAANAAAPVPDQERVKELRTFSERVLSTMSLVHKHTLTLESKGAIRFGGTFVATESCEEEDEEQELY